MRKTKFRGIDKKREEWVYGHYYAFGERTYIIEPGKTGVPEQHIEVIPRSVGQYTGLSDKKNVEIYEGDIMKRKASHIVDMLCKKCGNAISPLEKDYIHDVIVFDEGSFKGQFDIKRAGYFDTISVYPLDLCEVIGNVYENPELLD